jgi:FMN phosphatase YigB (HAD superfamily)
MDSGTTRFALFDLDDTLVDSTVPMRAWARSLCERYELPEDSSEWIMKNWRICSTWQDFTSMAAHRLGRAEAAAEWTDDLLANYPLEFVLDPSAAERLEALRADGWKLGIVTNGGTTLQAAKINQVGLGSYVDAICVSEAEGVRKPDRAIFENAARKLGVDLGPHGWMVGDTLSADIAGGLAAGLRTVWLPGEHAPVGSAHEGADWADGEPRPHFVRSSIVEALDLILASA